MVYGLLGKTLKHSYSKKIHEAMGYPYRYFECAENRLEGFLKLKKFDGINVTIPYKQSVIPYLYHIDESAQKIGAVNTVVNRGGLLYGYNTDFNGMIYALKAADIKLYGKVVVLLGSGGTARTARAVCESQGAKSCLSVSRGAALNYESLGAATDAEVLINCTPVGMFPDNNGSPVDLTRFPHLSAVFDCIYNPFTTRLLSQAAEMGLTYSNGLKMLVAQAKYSRDLFLDGIADEGLIESIYKSLALSVKNIVLVGMPSSGKSSVGRTVAKMTGRPFFDLDFELEKQFKIKINDFIPARGEQAFRELETTVIDRFSKKSGAVIATGGGAVLSPQNRTLLKQNGDVVWLKRDLEQLCVKGRPLSKNVENLKAMYTARERYYDMAADFCVECDAPINIVAQTVIDMLGK